MERKNKIQPDKLTGNVESLNMTRVFDHLPDGIQIIDKDHNVLKVNKAFTKMIGFNESSIVGRKCSKVCNNSLCRTPRCPLERILNGEEHIEAEVEVTHCDGFKIPCLMSVTPYYLEDGEPVGIVVCFKDITERKQVEQGFKSLNEQLHKEISKRKSIEEMLRTHKREYEALIKILPVGIFHDDAVETNIVTNDFISELLGVSTEEIDNDTWVKSIFPEDRPKVLAERERCIQQKDKFRMDFRIMRPDGNVRWILSQVIPYEGYGRKTWFVGSITDITEYIDTQNALQKSEEKLKQYIDRCPDGIFISDIEGNFIEVNHEACRMTGYTEEELLNMKMSNFQQSKEGQKAIDCLKNTGRIMTLEYTLIKQDGTEVPVEIKAVPLSNGLYMSFVRDVSYRKSIEDELAKREEQYCLMFENSPLGIFHINLEGAITDCNDKVVEILATSKEKLIGFNMLKDLKDDDMKAAAMSALNGQLGYYEDVYQSVTSGKQVPLKAVFRGIRSKDHRLLGAVAIIEDVSRRKLAEEALRNSEQLLAVSFDSIQDGMSVIDKEHNVLRVNSTIENWFPKQKPIVGKKCYEVFHNRFEPCQPCQCFEVLHKGATSITTTQKIYGKQAILEHFYFPLVGPTGQSEGIIAYIRDITEKTYVERELSRLENLNLIGEMAASIGHEVRNPLTSVRGFLQLLRNKDNLEVYGDYFNLMISELDRANLIITDFLSFTKKHRTNKRLINLNKVINTMSVLIEANAIAEDKSILLELDEIPDIVADEKEIEQLLLNLARNGLEAMEPGRSLTIKTYKDNGQVVLMVKDEGEGIKAEIVDKLGTPFVTTKEKGTGLGLVVCNSIVERHLASMDFRTGPGGTCFFVKFKINKECRIS